MTSFLHQELPPAKPPAVGKRARNRLERASARKWAAAFAPFRVKEVALAAIYHELAAIVEYEVQLAAVRASDNSIFMHDPEISHFSSNSACVEQYYNIQLDTLRGARTTTRIREIVNDLKHRRGREDRRRPNQRWRYGRVEFQVDKTYQAISDAESFVLALRRATRDKRDARH